MENIFEIKFSFEQNVKDNVNQSRLNLTVTYKKNKFVTENRLSYDNIRKGHQEQTGIA